MSSQPGYGEADVFGVWSLRILDAFLMMNPSVLAASVHRDGSFPKHSEPFGAEVRSPGHRSDDTGEGQEVLQLAAHEWLRLEEGDHLRHQVIPIPDHEHQWRVRGAVMVLPDPSTAEPLPDQVKYLPAFRILADVELWNELPTNPRPRIPLNGDVEWPFSVDVSRNVGIQPFLLIDRTRRFVTSHVGKLSAASDIRVARDPRCFQQLAEFKDSNGQTYCLATF